jgi:serine/threonine protein phosphatase PrpC
MKISAFGDTDVGKVRRRNEDAFLCSPSLGVFAVADGLGGLSAGDVASKAAIDQLEAIAPRTGPELEALRELVELAHRAVQEVSRAISPESLAATTLLFARALDGRLQLAWAGDSPGFLWRDGELRQVTRDHNVLNESPEEALLGLVNPHAITRCLGQPEPLEAELAELELQPGDRVLLCSDGITNELELEELAELTAQASDPQDLVRTTIEQALAAGGRDNATIVAVFIS